MKRTITILIAALAVLALATLAGGTLAYFTTTQSVQNVITTGNIKVELTEASSGAKSFPIMPGTSTPMTAAVSNTGDNGCWIRISVTKTIQLAGEGEADVSLLQPDFDTEHWTEQDGYYYYNKALTAGETTEPLFTEVRIDPAMGNLYADSSAKIVILVEAVQTANNGESPLTAKGWPNA